MTPFTTIPPDITPLRVPPPGTAHPIMGSLHLMLVVLVVLLVVVVYTVSPM